jgi:hypothetical protein
MNTRINSRDRFFVSPCRPGTVYAYSDGDGFSPSPDFVEVTEQEAFGVGWRADLAKPTTYENCVAALRKYHFYVRHQIYGCVDTLSEFLAASRTAAVLADADHAGARVIPESAAGHRAEERNPPVLAPTPPDFMSWLMSENKRAAMGVLPPLQQAQVDAMKRERQRREEDADKAHNLGVTEGRLHVTYSQFDEDDYVRLTGG